MKIYLASAFYNHPVVEALAAELEQQGHEITSHWHRGTHLAANVGKDSTPTHAEAQSWANEDVADVVAADTILSLTEVPANARNRGGRHVEFGLGLALNKRMIILGPREHVFHYLPEVECFEHFGPELLAALSGS